MPLAMLGIEESFFAKKAMLGFVGQYKASIQC
jgi:hypothetical protein